MKIAVLGANGRVGRIVVRVLLDKGHSVIACIHGNDPFPKQANLKVKTVDVYKGSSINSAIMGSEVVVSTLGSWGTTRKDILSQGMSNIIPAMRKQNITRIVSLTGADAKLQNENIHLVRIFSRFLFQFIGRKILKDGDAHIDLLKNSGLTWTVLRSPVMNSKGSETTYRLGNNYITPWHTINRSAVAHAIVELVESEEYPEQAPYISRG
jgi:putative NADH-flavin reductase